LRQKKLCSTSARGETGHRERKGAKEKGSRGGLGDKNKASSEFKQRGIPCPRNASTGAARRKGRKGEIVKGGEKFPPFRSKRALDSGGWSSKWRELGKRNRLKGKPVDPSKEGRPLTEKDNAKRGKKKNFEGGEKRANLKPHSRPL